jgi:putative nucleotidyltransferase with HDIG domain
MAFRNIFDRTGFKDNPAVKFAIGIVLVLVIAMMFPRGESIDFSYTAGSVWTNKDLIAPFSFPIYKDPRVYEKERQNAARAVYPVFEREQNAVSEALEELRVIVDALRRASETRGRLLRTHSQADSLALDQALRRIPFAVADGEWDMLSEWVTHEARRGAPVFRPFEQRLAGIITTVLNTGVIEEKYIKEGRAAFALRRGTTEEIVPYERVYDTTEAVSLIEAQLRDAYGSSDTTRLALKLVRQVLQPNIIFNQRETNRAIQTAEENVPRTLGFVQENERIVSKHERVTEDVRLKLDSFGKAKVDRGTDFSRWQQWFGITLHVTLIVGLYAIYLFLFRKRIFHDNAKLTLVALLLVMVSSFAYLSLTMNVSEPIQYLIFVPAVSMLLTIIFDSRVGFYGTVVMALLVAGIRGNDYSIALASLIAGALGAYTVRDIRNRTQIFRSLIFIFLGYAAAIVALSLERFESVNTILTGLTFALANSVFSPVLTYGLLIFFERVFRVTTDLTLLELSDFNHPLLRQLSEKAPGTFHHSMLLGSLAEAAADSIGSNSILARVGAYYHDIGKMMKPEYFVENQQGGLNRHNRLKPRMSALIIASHVKEGLELGKQHGLPEKILDFIPQHHGTTLIAFFYDKAVRQAAKKLTDEVISEDDFRYPGPKPQSKEAAIVMLADSVEASTRAIPDISPQKLSAAIEQMIKQRFIEGQLDECDLTLKDLTRIKEAFLKILVGIHHQRITYPEPLSSVKPPARSTRKSRQTGSSTINLGDEPFGDDRVAASSPSAPSSPEGSFPNERSESDTSRT